jgi:hypothetical protein
MNFVHDVYVHVDMYIYGGAVTADCSLTQIKYHGFRIVGTTCCFEFRLPALADQTIGSRHSKDIYILGPPVALEDTAHNTVIGPIEPVYTNNVRKHISSLSIFRDHPTYRNWLRVRPQQLQR